MADSRKLALSHEARLRTEGLEALKRHLTQVLEHAGDPVLVAELQGQLQKIDRAIANCLGVRRLLETARKIRGPSFEMIDAVTRLIGEVAEAAERAEAGAALVDLARQKVVQFTAQIQYVESLTK
jgi:hypothetical protein